MSFNLTHGAVKPLADFRGKKLPVFTLAWPSDVHARSIDSTATPPPTSSNCEGLVWLILAALLLASISSFALKATGLGSPIAQQNRWAATYILILQGTSCCAGTTIGPTQSFTWTSKKSLAPETNAAATPFHLTAKTRLRSSLQLQSSYKLVNKRYQSLDPISNNLRIMVMILGYFFKDDIYN